VVGVDGLDVFSGQREEAEPVGGVAPVAVEAHFAQGDGERVTGFRALDVEGAGERVAGSRELLVALVLAAGVEGLG
jgi:hypothetical protein